MLSLLPEVLGAVPDRRMVPAWNSVGRLGSIRRLENCTPLIAVSQPQKHNM
jgi:hypothetical protein